MVEPPVPTLLALLICDTVIQDVQTTKKSLIGIFTVLNSWTFPAPMNVSVFARLTDAEGRYKFRVDVVDLSDGKTLASLPTEALQAPNQLVFIEMVMQIQGLVIPSPGKYEFQVWGNDVYLGRTIMEAKLIGTGG